VVDWVEMIFPQHCECMARAHGISLARSPEPRLRKREGGVVPMISMTDSQM
jgi:hypothetical protein